MVQRRIRNRRNGGYLFGCGRFQRTRPPTSFRQLFVPIWRTSATIFLQTANRRALRETATACEAIGAGLWTPRSNRAAD